MLCGTSDEGFLTTCHMSLCVYVVLRWTEDWSTFTRTELLLHRRKAITQNNFPVSVIQHLTKMFLEELIITNTFKDSFTNSSPFLPEVNP